MPIKPTVAVHQHKVLVTKVNIAWLSNRTLQRCIQRASLDVDLGRSDAVSRLVPHLCR